MKKRLYQIFLFYCRENKSAGLTFDAYSKSSQMIDLRLFLKYFKDFQYVEANKFRFKVTTATQLFRNSANNGLALSYNQFWTIHKQLFDLQDLNLTKNSIKEADISQVPYLKYKIQEQIDKIKYMGEIVSEQRTQEVMKQLNTKT